jgi:hypothetical protein
VSQIELTSIFDVSGSFSSSLGTEQTKDRGLDLVWVVLGQELVNDSQDVFVGVLLGNFTPAQGRVSNDGSDQGKSEENLLLHFRNIGPLNRYRIKVQELW